MRPCLRADTRGRAPTSLLVKMQVWNFATYKTIPRDGRSNKSHTIAEQNQSIWATNTLYKKRSLEPKPPVGTSRECPAPPRRAHEQDESNQSHNGSRPNKRTIVDRVTNRSKRRRRESPYLGVARPVGGGHDDLVPRSHYRQHRLIHRLLGPVRDDDISSGVRQVLDGQSVFD